ncbi:MAG TPA: SRPBCC family protein [Solirubrobacterales bacterium]|nr:SRPBCC family protein [Solirubrobacterales bacterium]
MGTISGEAAAEIEAAIADVYAVAADAEGAPRWQPEIEAAECLERDADGNQLRVRLETPTPVKRLTSVLAYTYRAPTLISWTQEEGDLKSLTGSWELEELAPDRTKATYRLEVDPGRILGMALRGPVVDLLRGRMVESMPGKLKAFVERR